MDDFGGIDAHQLTIFFLVVRDVALRKPLEARPEAALGTAGAPRDSAELTLVAGEEADDQIGLTERVGSKTEPLTGADGHLSRLAYSVRHTVWRTHSITQASRCAMP